MTIIESKRSTGEDVTMDVRSRLERGLDTIRLQQLAQIGE